MSYELTGAPWRRAGAALAALAGLGLALLAAQSAAATFPGANGVIAFASDRDVLLQHPQVFSVSGRGGQPRNLSRSAGDESDPAPSPDGRRIAFSHGGELWLMNAGGGGRRLLVPGGSRPVWSPNGRSIAFNAGGPGECPPPSLRCGHTVAVWIVRLDGSPPRLLEASSRNASWSPNGRRIAYEGSIDPYGSPHGVRVANADGTNRRWIARTGGRPAWSPDGRSVAYATERGIRLVRADGTRRRRVSSDGRGPIWEPRGGRLAHTCGSVVQAGGRAVSALCVVGPAGRGRRVVARGVVVDGNEAAAAWSPRGPRLAYASREGIFVVGADGRNRKRIARLQRWASISSLAWSVLGRISFGEELYFNDLEVHTVAADGSSLSSLTQNETDDFQPSWTPDGGRLAFVRLVRGRPTRPDVWVMNADGSGQRAVVRNGLEPSWTVDGRRLVFTRYNAGSGSTYSAEVSTGREELLVAGGYHGTPSPDGARLAFVRGPLGSSSVAVAALDGSGEKVLARGVGPVGWSPDGGTLVFSGCLLATLCTVGIDGFVERIPVGEPWPHVGSYSPDAATLVFSSGTQYPASRIEVVTLDGSGRRVVTAARGRNQDPAWQPVPR